MLRLDTLAAPGIAHAFFTREGGVSEGPFAALNCGLGSGDDPDRVAENRARAAARLGVAADWLLTCRQVHGAEVVTVARPWPVAERPDADAMVTRARGVALGILTADCVPVLFADDEAGVIGACHAGWRGAVADIMAATVRAMATLGAEPARIRAGIGPAIGRASYQVGPDLRTPFLVQDAANEAFFVAEPDSDRFRFDLPGYVAARLGRLGLRSVAATGGDTAAEPARFFSYRRARLAGETRYGSLLSAIALT